MLNGKIALVTGASRGIGKGIAHELCAAGATVYITGRTVDSVEAWLRWRWHPATTIDG